MSCVHVMCCLNCSRHSLEKKTWSKKKQDGLFWQQQLTCRLLAILDNKAVIIYGHSVKGIETVVRHYENTNKTSSWILTLKGPNAIWCHQIQLCFIFIFLILGVLYNWYQKGDFPTGLVMKKCPKHSSFSLFWRLSVWYQWYIKYIDLVYLNCWTNQIPTGTVAVVDTVLQLNTIRSMQLIY